MTDIEILESLKSYTSRPEVIDKAIQNINPWIFVSEQLPRNNHAVLVYDPIYKNIYCAYLNGRLWTIYGTTNKIIHNVIAWMYLPEPPHIEENINENN